MNLKGILRRIKRLVHAPAQFNDQALVRDSGLFDADWYLLRYPDVQAVGMDALTHYLSYGAKEGRDPGPKFSSVFYVETYPDVLQSEAIPLLHYLKVGAELGHEPCSSNPRGLAYKDLLDVPPLAEATDLRIGLVLHAYYPDLIQSCVKFAANLPHGFNFYVGVNQDSSVKVLQEAMDQAGFAGRLEAKQIVNRGRNFGTLSVLFGPQVLEECDLICHIHTKKSLFTGEEQHQWRDQLIGCLLRDRDYVSRILGLFRDDPKLGVISPYPDASIAYYLYSKCLNGPALERLSEKTGVPLPDDTYFDFPVGGMFWARTGAIRPLLDGRITFDDFDPEPCGVDGSLAHAMERMIIQTAQTNGYGFIELDGEFQVFARNYGSKNLSQYTLRTTRSHLRGEASKSKVVSFGFEDTLFLARNPGFDPVDIVPRSTVIDELKDLLKAGKRVIIVTDSLQSSDVLSEILSLLGILDSLQIYVDNGCAGKMADGTIWPEILREERIRPEELLHVGSDPMKDFHFPSLAGIRSIHLLPATDLEALRSAQRKAAGLTPVIQDWSDPFEGR